MRRFDPDRFLPSEVQKRPGLAFIPFGFGQRKCPGYKFSLFEGLIMTVHVVRKFKILPASKDNYHIEPNFGFVTKPEKEVWVKLEKRQ